MASRVSRAQEQAKSRHSDTTKSIFRSKSNNLTPGYETVGMPRRQKFMIESSPKLKNKRRESRGMMVFTPVTQDGGIEEIKEEFIQPRLNNPSELKSLEIVEDEKVSGRTKFFIVKGNAYNQVKNSLRKRGWVEVLDEESLNFDLKWTVRTRDIKNKNNPTSLKNHQMVNHFSKAIALTTKCGLTTTLRSLPWFAAADSDSFYPRCFDCTKEEEIEHFVTNFQATRAQSILKTYVRLYSPNLVVKAPQILNTALDVCSRITKPCDEMIDTATGFTELHVSHKEWIILNKSE
jgi:hypothetical protein